MFKRARCLLILTVLLSLAATHTFAADKKTTKKKTVEEELRLKAGDETGNESKSLKAELLINKTEKEAMAQLDKLLKRYKGTGIEPELLFRKAELHMRRAKTVRFFELYRDSGGGMQVATTLSQSSSSKKAIEEAISTYESIERRFLDFRNMDSVLFNHAFASQNIGQKERAEKIYNVVISKFSNSPWVADSYLAIGDMNFERKNLPVALSNYDAIKKFPDSRVYPYGVYKAGWTRYNMKDNDGALKDLEQVVKYSQQPREEGGTNRLELRKEALNDMALFFEESKSSADAYSYFREQAGEADLAPLLLRLSRLYERHGAYKDIERVLVDLIDHLPKALEVPQARRDLIVNYDQLKNVKKAVKEMAILRDECRTELDTLNKSKEIPKDQESLKCVSSLREATAKLASKWHKTWLRTKTDSDLAQASQSAYEIYLSVSEKEDRLKQEPLHYAYAELLFQRDKFREASGNYETIARRTQDEKLIHDAAYGALVGLEKAVGSKWSDEDEKRFQSLAALYQKRNPKGQYIDDIRFKVAFIAYEKGRYAEAMPTFHALAVRSESPHAIRCQDLYMDVLNIMKKYGDLKKASFEFLASARDPQRKTALQKVYQESYLSDIQAMEESGQTNKAIAEYKKFATENPDSKWADKAWWNALTLSEKLGYVRQAAEDYLKFTMMFPKSDRVKGALVKSAQLFETMGALREAATVMDKLAEADKPNATQYLMLSADFKYISGDEAGAKKIYWDLLQTQIATSFENASKAFDRLHGMAKDHGPQSPEYASFMSELSRRSIAPFATYADIYRAEKLYDDKKFEQAFTAASHIIGHKDARLSKSIHARARLIQAKILENEFRAQSVNTRPDRVALVLSLKTDKLDKAQRAYQDVMKYNDPMTTIEALERTAGCYGHYVEAARNMTLGSAVSKADLDAFRNELEQIVSPMEEKQVEAVNQALKLARQWEIRDGKIARLQNEMNKLNMRQPAAVAQRDVMIPDSVLPRLGGTL